ncbi:hypothetical protein ACFVGM_09205 [Kitasatospora purpeofusca]|uniref:hypothetical protein n=1 Tax=Kitasatospora purpeofusca TaxID=67352 RepID=UPI0036C13E98
MSPIEVDSDTTYTVEAAQVLLRALKPGDRISILDKRLANDPGQWRALFVVEGKDATASQPKRCCTEGVYGRVWQFPGFATQLCAHMIESGQVRLRRWWMPENAVHLSTATAFDDPEKGRLTSTRCGVLLTEKERTRHPYYVQQGDLPESVTCPGCRWAGGMTTPIPTSGHAYDRLHPQISSACRVCGGGIEHHDEWGFYKLVNGAWIDTRYQWDTVIFDERWSFDREWGGTADQQHVVRFGGRWVGTHPELDEAKKLAFEWAQQNLAIAWERKS